MREFAVHLSVRLGLDDDLYGRACDTHHGWYGRESAQRTLDPSEVTCGRCRSTTVFRKRVKE